MKSSPGRGGRHRRVGKTGIAYGRRMVGAGFDVAESGTLLRKDLSLALELAESAAADLGGLEATAARALQLADENSSG